MSRIDMIAKLVNANTYYNYEYMGMVNQEALRYQAPFPGSTAYNILKECKAGDYNFKKGDKIIIMA